MNYTFKLKETLKNDYVYYGDKVENKEHLVEIRTKFNKWRTEFGYKNSQSLRYQVPIFITDDLNKNHFTLDLAYDLNRNLKFAINIDYGIEEEIKREINTQELSVMPAVTFTFLRKGIVRSSFKFINVDSNAEELPYTMNEGLGKGVSYKWNSTANYSFSKSVKGNLYYTGRYYSYDTKPFHELRVEVRMEF